MIKRGPRSRFTENKNGHFTVLEIAISRSGKKGIFFIRVYKVIMSF